MFKCDVINGDDDIIHMLPTKTVVEEEQKVLDELYEMPEPRNLDPELIVTEKKAR